MNTIYQGLSSWPLKKKAVQLPKEVQPHIKDLRSKSSTSMIFSECTQIIKQPPTDQIGLEYFLSYKNNSQF